MKIHEYQGKELFDKMGVPTVIGKVCRSAEEAMAAYDELVLERAVVKAQVLTGGRGKAGGIKLTSSKIGRAACRERV